MAPGSRRNVHPFPARMAPDVALAKIEELSTRGSLVLDPMCGSGTVPRIAAMAGRLAMGSDVDPLAVLMTRTACTPSWSGGLVASAEDLVAKAERIDETLPRWILHDQETRDFVEYWFAEKQRWDLGRLARLLDLMPRNADPLRLALSRIIVTKSGGASLARDTSHSRPHRVTLQNDFDVFSQFIKSADQLSNLLDQSPAGHPVSVRTADARSVGHIKTASIDLIVTSPPYLNAIDYIRGHRLTLVWLGWKLSELRLVRGESIGAESGLPRVPAPIVTLAKAAVPQIEELPVRHQRMVWRFAKDMDSLCRSMSRVAKNGSHMVLVVADSMLKGVPISNSSLASRAAQNHGFHLMERLTRPLPQQHRYLPPPEDGKSTLTSRMREELILTLQKR